MIRQISLRLPGEMHERLKAAAERNRRSLHAEILWRLEQCEESGQGEQGTVEQSATR